MNGQMSIPMSHSLQLFILPSTYSTIYMIYALLKAFRSSYMRHGLAGEYLRMAFKREY